MQTLILTTTIANLVLAVGCAILNAGSRNWSAVMGWAVAALATTQLLLIRIG